MSPGVLREKDADDDDCARTRTATAQPCAACANPFFLRYAGKQRAGADGGCVVAAIPEHTVWPSSRFAEQLSRLKAQGCPVWPSKVFMVKGGHALVDSFCSCGIVFKMCLTLENKDQYFAPKRANCPQTIETVHVDAVSAAAFKTTLKDTNGVIVEATGKWLAADCGDVKSIPDVHY